jgi:lipopolysaccharide transport system permease protein
VSRSGFLLRELVTRDIKARYTGSLFGFLWAFVNPLWQLVIYSIVFSSILRIELTGEATQSFPAFLFAGLLPWMAFSEGVSRGTACLVENGELIKKHAFPAELLVASVTLSALVHEAIALALFAAVRGVQGGLIWSHLPALLAGLSLQVLLTFGLALLLAAAYIYFRDIQHGLGLALQAVFYLTPMIYPMALVPGRFRWAVEANPLSTVVALYRAFLLGSSTPPLSAIGWLVAISFALFASGLFVFRRFSRYFADEL